MPTPDDARALAALEQQLRALNGLVARFESVRRLLLPTSVGYWQGPARLAYDGAVASLRAMTEETAVYLDAARDHTRRAVANLASRV